MMTSRAFRDARAKIALAMSLTNDAAAGQQSYFRARKAEAAYAKALRSVARHIGEIVGHFAAEEQQTILSAMLAKYAEVLRPWAHVTSRRMLADVARRDETEWHRIGQTMSRALREEVQRAPTGELFKMLQAEQVDLITSMPIEAAKRVHQWTMKGLEGAVRADEVTMQIMRTGEVTKNRAKLIARTEVARAASNLMQARATYVGSEGYIWRTAEDRYVRNVDGNPVGSHRKLNGKYIRWDAPPVASTDGSRAHAGQIYNCRCYPEPVIPEVI